MTHEQIQTFLTVVQERSISRAADKLFISQSTVSYRINALENELHITLIVRNKGFRTIELTSAGERFIFIAQRWQSLWDESEKLQVESDSVLQIGGADSVCNYFLRPFFLESGHLPRNMRLSLNTMMSMHTYSQLENREIDIGFVTIAAWHKNIILTQILRENYKLLCYDPDRELSDIISPDSLNPKLELFQPWGPEYQQWHDYWWPQPGQQALYTYTMTLIEPYLCQKGRWTIVPDCVAFYYAQKNGLRSISIADPPQDRISYLAVHKYPRGPQAESIRSFQHYLKIYLEKQSSLH